MGLLDRLRGRPPRGSEVRARLEGAMARRRLRGWQPPLENINSLVASGGPRLLARARELVVSNGYAANACEAFAANLVGDGIKPSIEAAERFPGRRSEAPEAIGDEDAQHRKAAQDVQGENPFPGPDRLDYWQASHRIPPAVAGRAPLSTRPRFRTLASGFA